MVFLGKLGSRIEVERLVDDSIIEVSPIAISQVEHEQRQIDSNVSSYNSARNFAMRFLRRR